MKGTQVFISFDGGIVTGTTGMSYAIAISMIETSNKDTGNTSTFESGRVNETMSVSGLASTAKESTKKGFWELRAAAIAGTAVTAFFTEYTSKAATTATSAKEKLSASVLISNLTWDAPDNDNITFSCDLQFTGDAVQQTNAAANTPVADAGANQTVNESTTVTLDATASTNGGSGTLSYLWTPPTGITLSSNTVAEPTFTAPTTSTYAEYEFSLQVYNGTNYSLVDKTVVTVLNVP